MAWGRGWGHQQCSLEFRVDVTKRDTGGPASATLADQSQPVMVSCVQSRCSKDHSERQYLSVIVVGMY